jgi:hypothetical protein
VAGPHKQYVRPGLNNSATSVSNKGKENAGTFTGTIESSSKGTEVGSGEEKEKDVAGGRKEVIIGGVAFEASHRSLVRKDCKYPTVRVFFMLLYSAHDLTL